MSPTVSKTLMTIGAIGSGITAALPYVMPIPALAPYVPIFSALAALLVGIAHVPRPGDLEKAKAATDALAAAIGREK